MASLPGDPICRAPACGLRGTDPPAPVSKFRRWQPVSPLDLTNVPDRHPAIDPNEVQSDRGFADTERILFDKTENGEEEAVFHSPSGGNEIEKAKPAT